jgi:hypothetical protein
LKFGKYVLVGITSTIIAMPIFQSEALDEEREQWLGLNNQH